jgi:hypothetical protein
MQPAVPRPGTTHLGDPDTSDDGGALPPHAEGFGSGTLQGAGSLGGPDRLYLEPGRLLDRFGMQPGGKPVSRARVLVFDDYIKSPTGRNLVTNSNELLDDVLGMFDQLAIHVVAGDGVVNGSIDPLQLSVNIQHSADGLNWLDKFASPVIPLTTILPNGATPATVTLPPGYDDGSLPSLALVRLRLNLRALGSAAAPISAKIKIHVTCNDRRETTFIAKQEHRWNQHERRVRTAQERAQKQHQAALEHAAAVRRCAKEYLELEHRFPEAAQNLQNTCQKQGVTLDEMMAEVARWKRARHVASTGGSWKTGSGTAGA